MWSAQSSIITELLGEKLTSDPSLCPGHNACMVCGLSTPTPPVSCPECSSVVYCSEKCREVDRRNFQSTDEEDAQGHTSTVCAMLKKIRSPDRDSCRSELESHPSTLSNLLLSHPSFEEVVSAPSDNSSSKQHRRRFQVHVVGAEFGSELWTSKKSYGACPYQEAYADALDEVCEIGNISSFELVFVGIGLPSTSVQKLSGKVKALTLDCKYEEIDSSDAFVKEVPDLLVFFNAGFTCPDYDWAATLSSVMAKASSPIPFFGTSNR